MEINYDNLSDEEIASKLLETLNKSRNKDMTIYLGHDNECYEYKEVPWKVRSSVFDLLEKYEN